MFPLIIKEVKFKKMKTYKILGIGMLLLVASCGSNENESDAFGNFETRETIISAESNGKMLQLNVEEGQQLKANTEVGLIDTTQLSLNKGQLLAKRRAIAANLNTIDANIQVLETQKATLETELQRIRNLIDDDAATQQQLDDLQGKYDVLVRQIRSTSIQKESVYAEIAAMDAQLKSIDDQLRKCHIVNPVNGTVLEKYVETHEIVGAGKSIYKIADLSIMDLRVYVSGSQLPHIKIGQEVRVYIDENKDENRELKGTISWISSKAEFTPKIIQTKEERVNLVYAVKVSVSNDGSIKIGMPGEIKLNVAE